MSEFSQSREFTAAGLSYWVRRLAESASSTKPVRLARVVRKDVSMHSGQGVVDRSCVVTTTRSLVIESGAVRVHVAEGLDREQLEMVLVAVGRAAKAGDT